MDVHPPPSVATHYLQATLGSPWKSFQVPWIHPSFVPPCPPGAVPSLVVHPSRHNSETPSPKSHLLLTHFYGGPSYPVFQYRCPRGPPRPSERATGQDQTWLLSLWLGPGHAVGVH